MLFRSVATVANVEDAQTTANAILNPPPTFGQPGARPPAGPPPAPGGPGRGPGHTGPAFLIKVSAESDGSFTVTNTRNGFSKTYAAKK